MELIKALPEVQDIEKSTSAFLTTALSVKVVDGDSFKFANGLFLDAAARVKAIDAKLDPKRAVAYKAYQEWIDLIKELKEPYLKARKHLDGQMTPYQQEQERKRQAEIEKLRQEAIQTEMKRREKEEERKMAEAAILEAAGAKEEAEQLVNEAIQLKEDPVVIEIKEPETPKVEMNGAAIQTNWKWEITDESKIPRNYMIPDSVKIGGVVRAMKENANIPGIRVWSDKKTRSTGR